MQNYPYQDAPDEQRIEALLSDFKPQPSPRFYDRMRTAPWQEQPQSQASRKIREWRLARKSAWIVITGFFVLVFFIYAVFPSVRVAASQIIHFFLPASSDQLDVQVTLSNPNDLLDFSNPANFPLTMDALRQQVGFKVKQIPSSLGAPPFIGARYDPVYNAVTLLYQAEDYNLLLTQRPLRNSQDVSSVGANAHVEFVPIGSSQGEFVVGGWKAVSSQPGTAIPASPAVVQINAVWDDNLPQSTLRWQESGYSYELRSSGENRPSQSQLISWANELK